MQPHSVKKPINVLTEYLTTWINQNSEESFPFECFETIRNKKVAQKDVERWVFNCNYAYYLVGEFLFNNEKKLISSKDPNEVIGFLEEHFKTIKDSNPLNLRSKEDKIIIKDFSKDWPPFAKESRNQLETVYSSIQKLSQFLGRPENETLFCELKTLFEQEECFYNQNINNCQEEEHGSKRQRLRERALWLLPLWTAKQINPLFSLLIWEDREAIEALSIQLKESFEENCYPSSDGGCNHDSYVGTVISSQVEYLEYCGEDERVLCNYSLSSLYQLFRDSYFSLEKKPSSSKIPQWLFGKTLLIWNTVICSLLGPKEALGVQRPIRTVTKKIGNTDYGDDGENMQGEVLLRRHYRSGKSELVGKLSFADEENCFLWKIIGREFDKNTVLPVLTHKLSSTELTEIFLSTQLFDKNGRLIEGEGDSRFHAELSVQTKRGCFGKIVLRDLNSKNGTIVMREDIWQKQAFVLKSRAARGALQAEKLKSEIPCLESYAIQFRENLVLQRGDRILLCDSCFEIL